MTTFYLLLRKSSSMWLGAVFFGLIGGLGSTVLLAMLHRTITSQQAGLGWRALYLFLGLCVLISVTRLISQYLIDRTGQTAILDLRMELGRKILSTPLRQLEEIGPSRLLNVLSTDVNTVSNSIILFPMICINSALVVGCLAYLATLSWPLFWILLGLIVVGGASYQLPIALGAKRFALARMEQENLFGYFRGLVHGTKELKLDYRRQDDFLRSFERSAASQRGLQISANLIYGAAGAWGHLLFFVVVGVIVYLRPRFGGVDERALVGYTLVLLYMMAPLQTLLSVLAQLGQSNAALHRIEELGLSLTELLPAPVPSPALEERNRAPWDELRLERITHQYSDADEASSFTLGPLDLRLRQGEMVFIVGGNGSGKTTLAKLLVGLYAPRGGTLYEDAKPVTDSTRDAFAQNFSAVFSDFFLFEELFGQRDVQAGERAQAYLQQLKLEHVVKVHDGKLSSLEVSRGQQKRLALLNAYLEDRAVYLFDEWAADQDPAFKRIFYLSLLPELKRRGKTVLAITHDDQFFHVADRIIKLNYGQVEFDGTVEEFSRHTFSSETACDEATTAL